MPQEGAVRARRARLGAWGVVAAATAFVGSVVFAVGVSGAAYVWHVNMLSDLGDSACRIRAGRWICSPGFALFNAGIVGTGLLLAAAGVCLVRPWGRVLAGSVVFMGVGLVAAGVFPAGDDGRAHLAAVALALVAPGLGLLRSGIHPETAWLAVGRVPRVVFATVALVLCAESRLPWRLVPRGVGEILIVGCLLFALLLEATRLIVRRGGRVSR